MDNYSEKQREKSKAKRQRELLALIREEVIGTQTTLAARLKARGMSCTQVSISRDIRELGLVKQGGRYVAPGHLSPSERVVDLSRNVSAFVRNITPVGDNLVVVQTLPGTAHSVGVLLDGLNWSELAGTVAGDDTIFVAVLGGRAGTEGLANRLRSLIKKETSHGE